jgi:hypothetical protein
MVFSLYVRGNVYPPVNISETVHICIILTSGIYHLADTHQFNSCRAARLDSYSRLTSLCAWCVCARQPAHIFLNPSTSALLWPPEITFSTDTTLYFSQRCSTKLWYSRLTSLCVRGSESTCQIFLKPSTSAISLAAETYLLTF